MAILKVARLGHPVLRQKANPVPHGQIHTKEFQQFLKDLIETMYEHDGVGLAAPQVHHSIRVCSVELREENQRYPDQVNSNLHIFINPEWSALTQETNAYWEGCLSVPGLRGLVARPNKLKVKYLDKNAKTQELVAEGFFATVLQHEFDHLDGTLYVDKLVDSTKLVFDQEFEKHILPQMQQAKLE